MSVLYDRHAPETPELWTCCDCGDQVSPPAVFWAGELDMLWHPQCAQRVALHLIGDAREATLAADRGAHWHRRAIATVRHRLNAEERVA